jgi:glutathione synthase/RimK-type ligase-like ATP-grasp enzyme
MSSPILVVERPERWPLDLPGIELVAARSYLTDPSFQERRGVKVYNLCRSYRYQSLGYYVSLLAEARGHRPLPSVTTIQDLKSRSLVRFISEDLDERIQKSLTPITSDHFTLSIYFGRNLAERHRRLALQLFNLFPAPFLRAQLERRDGSWQIQSLKPIAAQEIPDDHRPFAVWAARQYFAHRPPSSPRPATRYDLAILVDPKEAIPPSNERALARFTRVAQTLGLEVELVDRDDYGRLGEFDALFIRQTTQVNHYTYRFSRRAAAEGLVVIDDPQSILRCANKVYLAERLGRAGIRIPRTVVVHRDNLEAAAAQLGLPAILKLPEGAFSQAVVRVENREAFLERAREFLEESDLVVAQEYVPTDFDWRVGVLDKKALYACRYRMAKGHWQIARYDQKGNVHYGGTEAVPLEAAPPAVIHTAVQAASLIGDGLYGVDLKERDGKVVVIEVNDNPNLDAGSEDAILGEDLYRRILAVFLERIERQKGNRGTP